MAKKLYVGGLPYSMSQQDLSDLFAQAGTVTSATIITDKMTGQSKGFGFVEMSTEEEAQGAISALNGKEVDGRNLTVNEARPMEARPPRQGGFNRGGGRGFGGGHRRDNW